mgnify:CR=1 FL=1
MTHYPAPELHELLPIIKGLTPFLLLLTWLLIKNITVSLAIWRSKNGY